MSRKLEIRTRMAEVQKEFSALSAELKDLEASEKEEANIVKFKDYLFKIGTYGHTLEDEDKVQEINDDDRATGRLGPSGLAYTGYEGKSQHFGYVMLKAKEDYARTKRILSILEAAQALGNEKTPVTDREKHIKNILGEA